MAAVFGDAVEGTGRRVRRAIAADEDAVVRVHRIHGALVVAPEGLLDDRALRAVDGAVTAARDLPVILELSACALIDAAVLEQLGGGRWALAEVRVVCPRRSARRLLARAGVPSRLPVFSSIEQAIA